jgi:hypothetical protein
LRCKVLLREAGCSPRAARQHCPETALELVVGQRSIGFRFDGVCSEEKAPGSNNAGSRRHPVVRSATNRLRELPSDPLGADASLIRFRRRGTARRVRRCTNRTDVRSDRCTVRFVPHHTLHRRSRDRDPVARPVILRSGREAGSPQDDANGRAAGRAEGVVLGFLMDRDQRYRRKSPCPAVVSTRPGGLARHSAQACTWRRAPRTMRDTAERVSRVLFRFEWPVS